ncbi:A-kinase-interacting protein 1 isoform X1 [Xenopus laevis]|uniref:A-kinase-interacting protein 1 n=2 Tax=Xenopus laevis TaxID=8355 RepID=A0A974D317_XENLA|nr:A-kinase-interacting protein 1 isoform X1 [Xenopus laevis]OCT83590.1 hypothetical protein XELAEV_18021732mg [Xenopus laevis]
MDGRYRRMEDSLKRSAELGRELLERVRCREVGWSCSWEGGPQEAELIEAAEEGATLEEAFAVMADFMRQTTQQCAMYHDCLANHRMSQQEVVHTCRFHGRKCIQTGSQRGVAQRTNAPAFTPITTQERPRDIAIEVAPGTYSVSAGLPRAQRQTHVVNICPGQSVDLTFSL